LKFFADRKGIEFPLLADPDSKILAAYNVVNIEQTERNKGVARPGYFFIDTKGMIREKFFEARYQDRYTGNNVIGKLFPELGDEVTDNVDAPHLNVVLEQSDRIGFPGSRITLTAEVQLPPDTHVYAPGVQGYKPIALVMDPGMEIRFAPVIYPRAKVLYLKAINERVPVFEGKFRITQDFRVLSTLHFSNTLGDDGNTFTIKGKLDYQACDKKTCYLPTSVPLHWQLQVLPLDWVHAPEAIAHKGTHIGSDVRLRRRNEKLPFPQF
jgi:hypothetical protein